MTNMDDTLTPALEPVHFSDLKKMALSPAHFRASEAEEFEATRVMRIGTIAHHIVLGPNKIRPLVRWSGGNRAGNAWMAFAAEHKGSDIVTDTEWSEAEPIAAAVLADPVARRLLEGSRFEVPMEWVSAGIKCGTRGLDIVGPRWVADFKATSCTEPRAWQRHAFKMLYPQQMAFYAEGCEQNAIDMSEGLFLIGVEAKLPHPVTVLRITEPLLEHARKSIAIWLERLRTCRENGHWPGYTQTIVDFELPAWLGEGGDE
jgi:hypothetical protein